MVNELPCNFGNVAESFAGRTVLITGAAGGIGKATARLLAQYGARLALVDRRPIPEQDIQSWRDAGASGVLALQCDVADEGQVESAYSSAATELGGPHVLVNIAGQMIYKSLETLTKADWIDSLSVNLLGAAFFIRQALLAMPPGGAIVNVSSVHAFRTTALVAPYAVAKAGLVSLTHTAAIEGKPKNIRVNAVLPGAIDTQLLWESPTIISGTEKIEQTDIGRPEEVAAAILFLACDSASFITGATLCVDGGRLAKL
jgi:NAD(P)-dependent dehydrogenase (short-subunit alcohol dehydrogenase family)